MFLFSYRGPGSRETTVWMRDIDGDRTPELFTKNPMRGGGDFNISVHALTPTGYKDVLTYGENGDAPPAMIKGNRFIFYQEEDRPAKAKRRILQVVKYSRGKIMEIDAAKQK